MSREYLKGIKSENRLNRIRLIMKNDPVIGGQPNDNKNEFTSNTPLLDLACTLAHIHASGVGEYADLRKVQNQPPKFFFGKGFMSGISSLKGNGILVVFGQWRDNTGRYAVKQFFYSNNEISYRNALSETTWSNWISILTEQSVLDYHKLKNVPLTSTLSDDKGKISTIYAVNEVNRKAVTAQKSANNADAKAVKAQKTADSALQTANKALPQKGNLGATNLDTLNNGASVGIYQQTLNVNATAERNYPVRLAGSLLVLNSAGITQVYIVYNGQNDIYTRNSYGGKWSNWSRTLKIGDISNSLGGSRVLPASQSLVNSVSTRVNTAQNRADSAYNLANSKQNRLSFIGSGHVMRESATFRDFGEASLGVRNLNDIHQTGIYSQSANVNATEARNYPKGGTVAGTLIVDKMSGLAPSAAGVSQIYIAYLGRNIFFRGSSDGKSWTSWKRILTDSDTGINSASKAQNGWWKCGATGVIYQWGTVDYARNPGEVNRTITFPIAFNVCLNVQATRKSDGSWRSDGGVNVVTVNRNNFIADLQLYGGSDSGLRGLTWFAVGY